MTLDEKKGFLKVLAIAGCIAIVFYGLAFFDAWSKPWTLWRSEWWQDQERDTKRVATFNDEIQCIREQRKKLLDDRETVEKSQKFLADKLKPYMKKAHMIVGRTIFGFSPSIYATMTDMRDHYFKTIDDTGELSPRQKEWAKRDALLPEITFTLTYFCTPTAPHLYWPFYRPDTRFLTGSDLADEGRRALASTAQKRLSEPEQKQ